MHASLYEHVVRKKSVYHLLGLYMDVCGHRDE